MKKYFPQAQPQFSVEYLDLLADLNNQTFFSPIYQVTITIVGLQVLCGSRVLTHITSDDDVLLWHLEREYQRERCA